MGRNTPILEEIIDILSPELVDPAESLILLERIFQDRLLVDAGNVENVVLQASQLRLQVDRHECSLVLDEIVRRHQVVVSVDMVEEVINDLFPDRFVEP